MQWITVIRPNTRKQKLFHRILKQNLVISFEPVKLFGILSSKLTLKNF